MRDCAPGENLLEPVNAAGEVGDVDSTST